MKAALKYFLNDIRRGENIDVYITLLLSLVLAILGIIGIIQIAILSAVILATLSVLTYNMLTTRRTLSDFSQVIATLKPLEDATLKDRYTLGPLKDRLQNVRTIWLLGPSLVNIWAPNIDLFFEIVRKGGEIRMLVFNPKCAYLPVLAEQIRVRPDRLKMDIVKTMDECTELAKDVHAAGKFEVRLIETIPGYSMVISDPSKPDGHMIVEYYGYRSSLNERPHVELDVARSRRWFDYYLNQYEELWKSAIPYKFDVLPA